jgi:hypothetical protein
MEGRTPTEHHHGQEQARLDRRFVSARLLQLQTAMIATTLQQHRSCLRRG